MMSGYQLATARRVWFVPDLVVWGKPSTGETEYLATETIDGVTSVMFGSASVGEIEQSVLFEQLLDHRGNHLPASIPSPRVIPRPRYGGAVTVVGTETPTGFKIANAADAANPVTVDLLVVELGD